MSKGLFYSDAGSSLLLGSAGMAGAGEAGLGMFPLGRGIARGGRGKRGAAF